MDIETCLFSNVELKAFLSSVFLVADYVMYTALHVSARLGLGIVVHICNLLTWRQKDEEFKANPSYIKNQPGLYEDPPQKKIILAVVMLLC